ncbi:hypothetical protein DYST_01611 [Dyella terrae]|nr:hypothetical protein DYST_01611 [Dyella terrae]
MWLFFCLDDVWLGMFWVVALLRLALSWGRPFGRGVDAKRLGRLMPAPSPLWGEGWGGGGCSPYRFIFSRHPGAPHKRGQGPGSSSGIA